MTKLLLTTLSILAPFVPMQQVHDDFDTFQTEAVFNEVFSDISGYEIGVFNSLKADYSGETFIYYAFPIYYDVNLVDTSTANDFVLFYDNESYNFYYSETLSFEIAVDITITNYIGSEVDFSFARFNSVGMSEIITRDIFKPVKDNTLYGSFFAFFTGFFPHSVVAEYNGIFTAIVVAFLLFLVFGFIFFLFRTIRRLMGFR